MLWSREGAGWWEGRCVLMFRTQWSQFRRELTTLHCAFPEWGWGPWLLLAPPRLLPLPSSLPPFDEPRNTRVISNPFPSAALHAFIRPTRRATTIESRLQQFTKKESDRTPACFTTESCTVARYLICYTLTNDQTTIVRNRGPGCRRSASQTHPWYPRERAAGPDGRWSILPTEPRVSLRFDMNEAWIQNTAKRIHTTRWISPS
ncbi:uncharacterized protein LY89DRAFT_283927 [Mollisia scopiformis]|uniref:Uncharacterized protein n=1 Tax=Mollisia scopiformis TaxID=149040 RepID=A0A132BA85_MOLSC|nr:uncharacterized protein LY89DRAFT_283927 [Mollisia scopiformis]KUJ09316.1 hypothetical protein LY89DRAFT_283927 [Mollisia scopiformis]